MSEKRDQKSRRIKTKWRLTPRTRAKIDIFYCRKLFVGGLSWETKESKFIQQQWISSLRRSVKSILLGAEE